MAGARTPFDENGLGYWPARSCEMVVKLLEIAPRMFEVGMADQHADRAT
jgi:hypothetical protein